MRWATYVSPTDSAEHPALVVDGALHGLRGVERLVDLLGDGERLAAAAERALADPLDVVAEADAALRAPIPAPPSIRDFMAFEEHVVTSMRAIGQELDPDWYEIPVFYFSNPAAVLGPRDDVAISPGSVAFDYELEVAAIVGTRARTSTPPTPRRTSPATRSCATGARGTSRCARCASGSARRRARTRPRRWARTSSPPTSSAPSTSP